jgi:endoglucanase Acf2
MDTKQTKVVTNEDVEYYGLEPWERLKMASETANMTIGQRIAHVGGVITDTGRVEFGSVMAVKVFADYIARDLAQPAQKPVAYQYLVDGPYGEVWVNYHGGQIVKQSRPVYLAAGAAQPAQERTEYDKLLGMSQDNYVSQFGSDAAANWIYDDLRNMFSTEAQPVAQPDMHKNAPELNTSQERVQISEKSNQMLVEAIKDYRATLDAGGIEFPERLCAALAAVGEA